MAKKEERFEVTFRDGSQLKDEGVRQILVDKETGVNYLCWKSGYGAAITPLLDSEGKVIVKVCSGYMFSTGKFRKQCINRCYMKCWYKFF